MNMISIKCPQCGENANVDTDREFGFCSYCGFKIELSKPDPDVAEAPTADSLLTRAELFLEENNYAKADEYFNKVLDIKPYTSKAYWGLLMCKISLINFDKLTTRPQPIEDFNDYKKAIKFAESEEIKQKYINDAQKKQAELDMLWDEKEKIFQKRSEVKQKENDARYIASLKSSIRNLRIWANVIEVVKAIHAFCAAICLISTAFLGLAMLGDFELILILIPVVFLSALMIGGTIGLDKLSNGLVRMYRAREDTLESMM